MEGPYLLPFNKAALSESEGTVDSLVHRPL